jgi:uncharacterized protein YcfL
MKNIIIIFLSIFLFTACTTKAQKEVSKSNTNEISKLLSTLIEKEKDIIKLTQELENCKTKQKCK